MVAQDEYQAGDGYPDEDQVLDGGHQDLGPGGDPDADHREDEHDKDNCAGDADRRCGAHRRSTSDSQD